MNQGYQNPVNVANVFGGLDSLDFPKKNTDFKNSVNVVNVFGGSHHSRAAALTDPNFELEKTQGILRLITQLQAEGSEVLE